MEKKKLLYALILPLILFFLSPHVSLAENSYKAESGSRKDEAVSLQKTFEGEIKDKALEAQTIIQNHLKGEFARPKTPCLAAHDTVAAVDNTSEEGGCKVITAEQKGEVNVTPPIANGDQLIVCVSFSMPTESLKALFAALDTNPDVKLVLRGLVDDSMDKTARTINDLGGVLEINPELFDRYQIAHVPTFVLVKPDGTTVKLAGNITLNHARELFGKQALKEKLKSEKTS